MENKIAKTIKYLRTELHLTQKQLADETGISLSAIIAYENSQREPNSKNMAILEKYFKVSGAFLRGETNLRNPTMIWDDQEIADLIYGEIPNISKNIFKLLEDEDKDNQHAVYTILIEIQSMLKSQNKDEKAKVLNIAMLNIKAINDTLKIKTKNKE